MFLSSVVLPAPRNPDNSVTGTAGNGEDLALVFWQASPSPSPPEPGLASHVEVGEGGMVDWGITDVSGE